MAEKHQTDYQKLKRLVDAFKEQHERISDEKGAGSEGGALRAQVNTVIAKADNAFAANLRLGSIQKHSGCCERALKRYATR